MGRTYVYHCDQCKKQFGNDTHINIRSGQAFISYLRMNTKDGTKAGWKSHPVKVGCPEKHFCNARCFSKYFSKVLNDATAEVKGK
jgi:hypothetical protein